MRRILYIMIICVFALGLLSGCSGEAMKEMETGKDVSGVLTGAAVSGQAVSGQVIQTVGRETDSPKKDAKKEDSEEVFGSRYCTGRYYYTTFDDGSQVEEGDIYVAQISLATAKRKLISVEGICEVVSIEGDYLYYLVSNDEEEDDDEEWTHNWEGYSLWRLPIERRRDGAEELRVDQREPVKDLDDIYYDTTDIYIDDQYIIYAGVYHLICYDRKSGKKTRLSDSSLEDKHWPADIERIYRNGGRIDIVVKKGIVTWDVKTGDVTAVYQDNALDDYAPLITGDVCFYHIAAGRAVLRMDMHTKDKTDFVSEEEFLDVLEEATGLPEKELDFFMGCMYYDQNHLYMVANVTYKKAGKTCYQDVVLSREDEEGSPLKYERDVTDYMWGGHGNTARAEWSEDNADAYNYWEDCDWADCRSINGGKVYILWFFSEKSDRADKMKEVVYDLKTKKVRPAKEKEMIMFEHLR